MFILQKTKKSKMAARPRVVTNDGDFFPVWTLTLTQLGFDFSIISKWSLSIKNSHNINSNFCSMNLLNIGLTLVRLVS